MGEEGGWLARGSGFYDCDLRGTGGPEIHLVLAHICGVDALFYALVN